MLVGRSYDHIYQYLRVRDYTFANDLFDRLDVILTYVSVSFNYMGPYFLK